MERMYIDGTWCTSTDSPPLTVISPATENVIAEVHVGGPADIGNAVSAAADAFQRGGWSRAANEVRADAPEALESVLAIFQRHGFDRAGVVGRIEPAGAARLVVG